MIVQDPGANLANNEYFTTKSGRKFDKYCTKLDSRHDFGRLAVEYIR